MAINHTNFKKANQNCSKPNFYDLSLISLEINH